jgi:mannose/fructose/N-acetylgalactosamine-specific phosphotransferase system component IIC
MSRKLYYLAASFFLLSLVACGLSFIPNRLQPGLPVNGSLSKTVGLGLLLASLVTTLAGVLTTMFEQVDRRTEERMRREYQEGLANLSRKKPRR